MIDVGAKLKIYRENTGKSQTDLARVLDITPELVCMWEKNKRHPRPALMKKLADIYGVTVDELFFS